MSLHALAGHMATKGRGGDSMLVHMTPEEVQSLQAMALKNGGSLTINPDTGLPEANFLKKMLPMIAGFALAPLTAGTSLAFLGATPLASALTVGGITGLATGSLSRGLMAGLGAYGGASLGAGLANMGSSAVGAEALAAANASADPIASLAAAKDAATAAGATAPTGFSALTEGASRAFTSPEGFKELGTSMGGMGKLAQTGLAAISPMLADQGVQTTTKMPRTGTIRNYTFDPYGQTYTSAGDYPANEAERKASGGIVALAEGGGLTLPEGWGAAGGKYDDPNEKISYFNQQGITPAQLAAAGVAGNDIAWMQKEGGYNVADAVTPIATPEGWGNYGGAYDSPQEKINYFNQQNITPAQLLASGSGVTQDDINWMLQNGYTGFNPAPGSPKYVQNVTDFFTKNPNATYAEIQKAAEGLNPADVQAAMAKAGLSGAAQFAAFNQNIGDTRNVEETYSGLKGLSSNINYWITNHPGASLNDFQNEMKKWELDENDIKRATGKTSADLFTGKITTVANPAEGASGATGAGAVGGGTVVNPNGTITTSPVIPGIPVGGFTGVGQVRDEYTKGGGSLGYANKAPEDMAEFNTRFNKQTGDSLAAYKYLMGQGANPVKSGVGEIMRPYSEATLGVPAAEGRPTQKYIFQGGKYVANPNYQPLSYNSKGERSVGSSSVKAAEGFELLKPAQTQANFDYVTYLKNNPGVQSELDYGVANFGTKADPAAAAYSHYTRYGKGEGRPFTMLPGAKPEDNDVFAWADTNKVSDAQLVPLMGISLAEVVKRRARYKKPEAGATGGLVPRRMALGGLGALAAGGAASQYNLGGYSDGGRLLRGPGNGTSDDIPATIGDKQPARLADGEFVIPSRIVSELGNGSTEAGARQLYAMMDRIQKARAKTTGKNKVAFDAKARNQLPA
jgi:hypothetical protein